MPDYKLKQNVFVAWPVQNINSHNSQNIYIRDNLSTFSTKIYFK